MDVCFVDLICHGFELWKCILCVILALQHSRGRLGRGGIRTSAVRSGDEWVINGSRIYITNTANADWLCLLAVNDPDAGYGSCTQITAAKELNKSCVRTILSGRDATTLITATKLFSSNPAMRVATECLQLRGGYGFMKESMAGRAFVDSRIGTIGGVSDETILQYLAK